MRGAMTQFSLLNLSSFVYDWSMFSCSVPYFSGIFLERINRMMKLGGDWEGYRHVCCTSEYSALTRRALYLARPSAKTTLFRPHRAFPWPKKSWLSARTLERPSLSILLKTVASFSPLLTFWFSYHALLSFRTSFTTRNYIFYFFHV